MGKFLFAIFINALLFCSAYEPAGTCPFKTSMVQESYVIREFSIESTIYSEPNDTLVYFYYINSVPFNASVILNGSIIGETPLRLYRDSKLSGRIIIRKEGYYDSESDISIFESGTHPDVILKPFTGIEKSNVMTDKSSGFRPKRNIIMIALSGAAAVGGGMLANYFKDKANEDYDTYLRTFDRKFYDSANKFDRYSLVSVILMQAAIGGLIYFLFLDN